MDSNNNDTEVPEDQPEEQALQLNVKDILHTDQRQKQNHGSPYESHHGDEPSTDWTRRLVKQVFGTILQGTIFLNSFILLQMDRLQLTAVYCNRRGVNTTPQMTSSRGAKRVHKIAAGKSYDELLQHDNKMRIWTRSENSEKWKIYGLVTKHNANANENIYACVELQNTDTNDNIYDCVAPYDANTIDHFHWASCAFSQVVLSCLHPHTHMHFGSSLSLSCHLHVHGHPCGLFTLILPFYFLLHLPPLFLFLNYLKSVVNLHNSCNESMDSTDEFSLSTKTEEAL